MSHLNAFLLALLLTLYMSATASAAGDPVVTPTMLKALADMPGKEVLVITVDYPPGGADPVHRHDAHAFVYVLEGSIVMQVKGGEKVTLTPGQVFYEGPNDVHTVGRNASRTKPAKFLVFLLKRQGADALLPVHPASPPPVATKMTGVRSSRRLW